MTTKMLIPHILKLAGGLQLVGYFLAVVLLVTILLVPYLYTPPSELIRKLHSKSRPSGSDRNNENQTMPPSRHFDYIINGEAHGRARNSAE